MHVITISLGRGILAGGRERERMRGYAERLESLTVIVLTRKVHGYTESIHEGNLHVYPTHTRTRIGMLVKAGILARGVARAHRGRPCVLSAQDPLEIGWVSAILARLFNMFLHIQIHGDYFSSDAWVGHSLSRRVRRFCARVFLRRVPAIRVVSERIKTSLIAGGVSESRITVLPIRPELEEFLAEDVSTNTGVCTFLFVGRLAPEKDIPRIIRAFALHYKKYPLSRLRIVGDGSEKEMITHLIDTLNLVSAVTLVPWTDNVPHEMAGGDVFLLASLHEAYALTLVEAMAVGLPLITTDVGCVGEVVQDGVQGIVVREASDASYADALDTLAIHKELRDRYGRAGKERARAIASQSVSEYNEAWVTAIARAQETVY